MAELPEAHPEPTVDDLPEEADAGGFADDALIASLSSDTAPEAETADLHAEAEEDTSFSGLLASLSNEPVAEERSEGGDVTPYAEAPAITVEEPEFDAALAAALEAEPVEAARPVPPVEDSYEDEFDNAPLAATDWEEIAGEFEAEPVAAVATPADKFEFEPFEDTVPDAADAAWPADPEAPATETDVSEKLLAPVPAS